VSLSPITGISATPAVSAHAGAVDTSGHGRLTLEGALLLVGLYEEKDSARVERAALRWHARLELEAKGLTLAESELALAALAALAASYEFKRDGF
jgi:hypothetical protein